MRIGAGWSRAFPGRYERVLIAQMCLILSCLKECERRANQKQAQNCRFSVSAEWGSPHFETLCLVLGRGICLVALCRVMSKMAATQS
jgi:hypothetical protein|tara:strand:+ start:596 stop:856 length:261 start_codon:yes stop_codon:yes gene_type:complete